MKVGLFSLIGSIALLLIYSLVGPFINLKTCKIEVCVRCGTVKYTTDAIFQKQEVDLDENIGLWYSRRVAASHDHQWSLPRHWGMSLCGRFQCACRPHRFEEYNTAIVIALQKLEKLDLDREYFTLASASSEDIGRTVCAETIYMPFNGSDGDIRAWFQSIREWASIPKDRRPAHTPGFR